MEALRNHIAQFQKAHGLEFTYRSFGRTDMGIIEVPTENLRAAAAWLRSDEDLRFDWLEFMSVYERKERVHLSYFIRSQSRGESCVLRSSSDLPAGSQPLVLPSLVILWPMLAPYEAEANRGFGVQFLSDTNPSPHFSATPADFPMRKSYEWAGRE